MSGFIDPLILSLSKDRLTMSGFMARTMSGLKFYPVALYWIIG
jgi:hypothetical protein